MDIVPFYLLVLEASSHTLLLLDGPKGEALAAMPYSAQYTPTGLAVTSDLSKAYIPAVGLDGTGALFAANLKNHSLYRLPLVMPHPMQFVLAPDDITAYFTAPDGALYKLNTVTLKLASCGQAGTETCTCVGLAANTEYIYSAWELESGGVIAVFSPDGKLTGEYPINGLPTNIIYDKSGIVMVPFTSDGTSGEGLFVFREQKDSPPSILAIQCPACAKGNRVYPCHAVASPDGQTAYVVNEDSGTITIFDLANATVLDYFSVGRSISTINLLPDSRFAVTSSNMFGDIALIDLVNGRLLALSEGSRDILSAITVLPTVN